MSILCQKLKEHIKIENLFEKSYINNPLGAFFVFMLTRIYNKLGEN